ncbi:E1 early protein [Bos taurus papillomavirus 41]|nr:E1 early protein [Bos taurus papillomavirus 41]
MASKGIDFILQEAECSDDENEDPECDSSMSDVSDLIDNSACVQGNSCELFSQLQAADYDQQLNAVKRKLTQKPRKPLQQRTLQGNVDVRCARKRSHLDDSGYAEKTFEEVVQVENQTFSESEGYGSLPGHESGSNKENVDVIKILQKGNARVTKLAKFKECFLVSYTSLTRPFQSNRTCCRNWVAVVFGAHDDLLEASKKLFQLYSDFIFFAERSCSLGLVGLYLFQFKASKNRDTVQKLFKEFLHAESEQLLLEPPKIKSVPAAVFWWKATLWSNAFSWGALPDWVTAQTSVTQQQNEEEPFKLAEMVQWAYDHNLTDEADIAYYYAKLAMEDSNASAFLKCNQQVKYVKECSQMVRYYKTAEMKEMTMGEWIKRSISEITEEGNWKQIALFLKFQCVSFISFLTKFKDFLHGIPKKNCLVIYGPPNTGKSMFAMSLLKAVKGKVLSFVNSKSHFWLQPLQTAKMAVLDDATKPTWDYIDIYLRNGLDGNQVCLDVKHKAPIQLTFPPILITTNVDVLNESSLSYLHSRVQVIEFGNTIPIQDNGEPAFLINHSSWKSFFQRLWDQLDLTDPEEEDGVSRSPFRCTAGGSHANL